ncbi:dual specificity protein kinase kns1 [Puccinia graminis f. sp. tritici]|uniref:Dual specificity protein kinase kns1 n=1 Tax=Puccinia graminis f. sp. tritici TaxID=56615 RepID=A0A5B0NKA4_PUCGR|nr:dual specificity protein kinase kns1 [Puccinia graminis f. sp. tritici]
MSSTLAHRQLQQDRKPTMSLSTYNTRSYHRALPHQNHQNSSKSAWKLDTFIDKCSGQSREIIVLADTPSPTPHSGPSKSSGFARPSNNNVISQSQEPQPLVKSKRKYENYSSGQQRDEAREAKRHEPERLPIDDKEGHYIVRQDDLLGDHRFVKLLGQGTFGKVVQATDLHAPIDRSGRRKEVAVKVIRAVQKYRDASKIEIKVLNLLRERDPDNVNKCIHLLDVFDYCNHICIVTELLSLSVFDFLKDNQYSPFPASHIQSFAKQLLSSVAFLHELRLVHTDLKPENILLLDASSHLISTKRGANKSKKVLRCSDIRLIDFGSATFEDEYHASVVSTRHYRAPEIILIEFFTGEALFQTHENLEHLAMMEAVFGPMPESFARRAARNRAEWFTKNYRLDYPQSSTTRQSRKFVRAMRPLEDIIPQTSIQNARFRDLLSKLLEWEPHKRITVKEALKHSYFTLKIDDEGTIY